MSKIRYSNYFFNKLDSKFTSSYLITDVQKTVAQMQYHARFSIFSNYGSIKSQADVFARHFNSMGLLTNSYLDNANRLENAIRLVSESYVYSYYKSLYYATANEFKLSQAFSHPINSLCFSGHKEFFDHITVGTMFHLPLHSSLISYELTTSEEIFQSIVSNDIINKWIDKLGNFFSPEHETVLNYMMNKCSDYVMVERLFSPNSVGQSSSLSTSPLANMCYSEDEQVLMYIEGKEIITDYISYFWNKANLIKSEYIPDIDVNDQIHDTTPISRFDERNIPKEVESITGLKFMTIQRLIYDTSSPQNGSNFPSDTGPKGPNNSGRNRSWKPDPNRGSSNNRRSVQKNDIGKVVSTQAVKLGRGAVNLIKRRGSLVDQQIAATTAQIIQDITGKKIAKSIFKTWYGKSVESVLNEYNIDTSQYDDEYNALFAERINDKYQVAGYIQGH
jgi:hypothetical protein